jgi:hypothetical protein
MPVVAVSGDDVIVGPGRRDRAGNDRFLADIKVTKAADLLRLILLAGTLLKAAARARPLFRPQEMQATKRTVKTRSLTSEFRKNIQLGVALY